ncbi:MAG: hypothetical protein ACI8T1_004986, partial [Verrucomicrobiales bacterium]
FLGQYLQIWNYGINLDSRPDGIAMKTSSKPFFA